MPKSPLHVPKYRLRPLSANLINHLLELCKKEVPMQAESVELIGILAPFQAKIANSGIATAYTSTPKATLMESLGESFKPNSPAYILHGVTYSSKEEFWEACYWLYAKDPTKLSLEEIGAAKEHMYLNELMSPEEVEEFELNEGVQIK